MRTVIDVNKQYQYGLLLSFIVPSGEIPTILEELKRLGLHESGLMTICFDSREPRRNKWEIRFSTSDTIAYSELNRQLASVMKKAWYGANETSLVSNDNKRVMPTSTAGAKAAHIAETVLLKMRDMTNDNEPF